MNFRHLKFFVATAESGQVSRAATQLSISQSAVTSAIKDLEAELGTALFHRTASGMEMTEAGRDFLASSREILEKLEQARRVAQKQSPVKGTISIAATYTVIGYFLPQHLDRLKQMFPISLEILCRLRRSATALLEKQTSMTYKTVSLPLLARHTT